MGNYSSKESGNQDNDHPVVGRNINYESSRSTDRSNIDDLKAGKFLQHENSISNDSHNADDIPTVFKWEHGGKNVYITGTFNNWERQIKMHRSGNDFTYIHNLKRGEHAFKFIVDDEWRYAEDQPIVRNLEGQISNYVDVSKFVAYVGDDHFFDLSRDQKVPTSEYNQYFPDIDDYTKEPPALPPHLRHIILNKQSPSNDPLALPTPHYVSLDHLYCTAIKDGMMVLGSTQRYKEKFCTIVLYSVMPVPGGSISIQ